MIRDYNIEWLRKRIWIPATAFTGLSNAATAATYTQNQGAAQFGATAGNVQAVQVASSGVGAVKFTANTDTTTTSWMVPYDLDITKQIDFRVHWTHSSTSAAQQWVIKYALMKAPANADLVSVGSTATSPGSTNLGVIAAPTTVLDTVVPSATSNATANTWEVSDFGSIKKASAAATPFTTATYALVFLIGMTGTLTATPSILGLEIRYSSRRTVGQRRNIIGGRRLVEPLGVQWTQTKQEGL